MKGLQLIIWWTSCLSVLYLVKGAELTVRRGKTEKPNSEITYVQIKPALVDKHELNPAVENYRSSRIEKLPLQIKSSSVPNYRVRTPSEKARAPRYRNRPSDYADGDKESEDRFDTNESLVSDESRTYDNRLLPDTDRFLEEKEDEFVRKNIPAKKRFFSLKKFYGGTLNAVEPSYRSYLETRTFRSRCRCERIENCPKLQMSVPRCPEEQFLCCF